MDHSCLCESRRCQLTLFSTNISKQMPQICTFLVAIQCIEKLVFSPGLRRDNYVGSLHVKYSFLVGFAITALALALFFCVCLFFPLFEPAANLHLCISGD